MLDLLFSNPILFLISFGALLLAITVHEFAHAYTADKLGDPTPRMQGRLTLNPIAHIDPLGMILMVFIRFGWGKPVQFDPYNLAHPRRDSAVIALAGPFSNLLLASAFSIVLRLISTPYSSFSLLGPVLSQFIFYNILLAVFNLVPIHPLDGGKILVGFLPPKEAHLVDRFLSRYGLILLLIGIFPLLGNASLITSFISPIVNLLLKIYLPSSQFI